MVPAVRLTGTVAELHGRDAFEAVDGPVVVECAFTDAAIVLGSRQTPDAADHARAATDGVSVVRRRSGGGAVLMIPGSVIWVDLVIPTGTPGWSDDVRASMVLAGTIWRAALDEPTLTVHDGGMVATPWSPHVCFAGTGPGEVLRGGAKLVGLSQRRTRHGAWIQGLVHTAAIVERTPRYLTGAPPARVPVPPAAIVAPHQADRLAARLADGLTHSLQFARSARRR